jgi:hypothetical protein
MTLLNPAQQQLCRHIIAWSWVQPKLISKELPTTLSASKRYLELASRQQEELLLPLGIKANGTGSLLKSPWMSHDSVKDLVLGDLEGVDREVRLLRILLDCWLADEVSLSSEAPVSPFKSIRYLNDHFRGLALFASEVLPVIATDPVRGIEVFYDREERQRRRLPSA